MKVLLVDDSKDILDLLGFLIQKEGHEVIHALRGQDALQILAQEQIDLVFLDIKMPEMDGIEVLKRIRQKDDKLAVVFLTAFGDEGLMAEAEKLKASGFVHKGKEIGFVSESVLAILRRFKKQ